MYVSLRIYVICKDTQGLGDLINLIKIHTYGHMNECPYNKIIVLVAKNLYLRRLDL